jgi:hypothetical protein
MTFNDAINQRFCSEMLHAGTTLTKFMNIQNIKKFETVQTSYNHST